MDKLIELKNDRANKIDEQKALIAGLGEPAVRDFTDEELKKFNDLHAEIKAISKRIDTEEKIQEVKRMQSRTKVKPEEKVSKRYSLIKAIDEVSKGRPLTGLEKELHEEAVRENPKIQGIGLPSFLVKRDWTVGTAATAGDLVGTELGEYMPALQPRLQVEALGATVMDGLTGNIDLPFGNALASATWEGETDAAAETTPTVRKVSLSPKRLAAFTDVSKMLLAQTSGSAERYIREEISGAIARAVDAAAINGSGSNGEPTGILNTNGIGDVAGGTDGLAPTRANLIDLVNELAIDNADIGNLAFLTTPAIRAYLQKLKTDAGSGLFVWDDPKNLVGYNAAVSTQVPSDLTKGASSGICHAILFGDWSNAIIANWDGADILVNPFTRAKEGLVELVANTFWDIGVKYPAGFAAMKDALTS